MSTRQEDVGPSHAIERLVVEDVLAALCAPDRLIDVAAVAGEPPDARRAIEALDDQVTEGSIVACVRVLERLERFVEVVEVLAQLSRERGATVVMAIPNHAWDADGAEAAATSWGDGAVAELRGLLPAGHVVFHEVALRGAAFVPADDEENKLSVPVVIDQRVTVPVAFVLAFGPQAGELSPHALARAADLSAERAFEHARTAEIDVLRARTRALEAAPGRSSANGAPPGESAR